MAVDHIKTCLEGAGFHRESSQKQVNPPTPNKALDEGKVPRPPPSLNKTAPHHKRPLKIAWKNTAGPVPNTSFAGPILPKLMASPSDGSEEKDLGPLGLSTSAFGQGRKERHRRALGISQRCQLTSLSLAFLSVNSCSAQNRPSY